MIEAHPIRAWRTKHRITLAALAVRAGVSASFLSQVECDRKRPSLRLAVKLAEIATDDATGIPAFSVDDLVRERV